MEYNGVKIDFWVYFSLCYHFFMGVEKSLYLTHAATGCTRSALTGLLQCADQVHSQAHGGSF